VFTPVCEQKALLKVIIMRLPVKLAFLCLLILILIIPFVFIDSLVDERRGLLNSTTEEISDSFGGSQTILTPVIMQTYTAINRREGQEEVRNRYIIPERLNLTGELKSDVKKRSIYSIPVYTGTFRISASFVMPEPLNRFTVADTVYVLSGAPLLGFSVSDNKGLKTFPTFNVNGVVSKTGASVHANSLDFLVVPLDSFKAGDSIKAEILLELNGTKSLKFNATGVESEINLSGDWGAPGFNGYILPDERTVTETGFAAKWRTTSLARKQFAEQYYMPQSYYWYGEEDFGLSLVTSVNDYSLINRAVKYGFLVVLLTFFVIFLLEILLKYRFHLVQYGFTGVALAVFFLLLLSISEYTGFTAAYLIASLALLILITVYIHAVFKRKATIIFTAFLTALLAFIYVLLNLDAYALLIGSLFVFAFLAVGMLATRKVDWQNI
jgi:inner membrane protein